MITYIGIAAAALIGSIIQQKGKNAAKSSQTPPKPAWREVEEEEEAGSTIPGWISSIPPAHTTTVESAPAPIPPAYDSPREHNLFAEGGRVTKDDAIVAKALSRSAQSKIKHTPEVEPEENNAIMEDFDLRKAVIYSEMLKPKFTEY